MKQIQYRDTKTGKFVSKSTWTRSKAQGGTRYKRQRIEHKKKIIAPPPPPPQTDTWLITFHYQGGSHTFNGEMRVTVVRRVYPNIDQEGIADLVQAVLEGEDVQGIKVEAFEVRGEDKTATLTQYDFASAFIRGAERIEQETIQLPSNPSRKTRKKKP